MESRIKCKTTQCLKQADIRTQTTTIEGNEIDKVKKMIKRGKIKHIAFPFSVDIATNVTSILGTSALDWFFTGKPSSDGLSYPSREGTGKGILHASHR